MSLPWWAHVGALVALLIVVAPFMRLGSSAWVEEEGRLGLQAGALDRGDWEYGYAGESFDAEHRWAPVTADPGAADRLVPAPGQPAHAVALAGVAAVVGTGAFLYLLPMAGLVVSAVVAWLLAREFDPRAARAAFWVVAAGPLLVNASVLWAYTLVTASTGFAVYAAVLIVRRGFTRRRGAGLAAALAIGALLSPEAVFFAGSVVVVVLAASVWRRRWSQAALVGVASSAATAAAVVGSHVWVERITGRWPGLGDFWVDAGGPGLVDRLETRAGAAWRFLLDGGNVAFDTERLVVAALVAAVGGGLFLRMRGREGRFVGATVACAAVLAVVVLFGARSADASLLPVLGLLAAWPLVMFGLAAAPWRETTGTERLVAGLGVLFTLGVVVAMPSAGDEREWGGRVLAPIVVPVGVVAAVGLVRRLRDRSWEQQAAVVAALVLLAAFPASRGLESVRDFRASNAEIEAGLEVAATDVVVIDNPQLVRTPIFSWRLDDDIDWYVSYGDAPGLLAALAEAGHDEVTILPDPTRETLDIAPYSTGEAVEAPALEARGIPVFRLTAPAAEPIDL